MGYVSFREGMFFLHTLGFLTKDLRGIECQNDTPQQGFSTSSPGFGADKMLMLPERF